MLKRNSVPDWPLIATYLISEASLESSSRWSSYIAALPRQPYSLLYWYSLTIIVDGGSSVGLGDCILNLVQPLFVVAGLGLSLMHTWWLRRSGNAQFRGSLMWSERMFFLSFCCSPDGHLALIVKSYSVGFGRYNDLRDRIFSKHSDLFPEEVCFTKVSMFFVETNDTRGLSDLDSTF